MFALLPLLASPSFSQTEKQVDSYSFTYQYLSTKEGLSNQRVFSILQDKQGFIWVATRSGKIFKYSPITDSFILEVDIVELSKGVVFLNQLVVDSQE